MNLHQVSFEDYTDIVRRAKQLDCWTTAGGLTVHVAEYAGNDVLVISDPITGGAIVMESNDANYGGSIHDHARHAKRIGTL